MNGSAEETVLEHKRLLNDVIKELEALISKRSDSGMEHQQGANSLLEIRKKVHDVEYHVGCIRSYCEKDLQNRIDRVLNSIKHEVERNSFVFVRYHLSDLNALRVDFTKKPFKFVEGEAGGLGLKGKIKLRR